MKYIKTYEGKKKTEDPLYHLAVAMKNYIYYLDNFQPIIKYFYTSIRIMNKSNTLNYIAIETSKTKTIYPKKTLEYFKIFISSEYRKIFNNILDKYKMSVYMDAGRFSYADVQNIIDDINLKIAAIKYNI